MAVRKSSEVIAEPGQLAARQDPMYTEIVARQEGKPDIRVRLRPLSYIERVFCEGKRGRNAVINREEKTVSYDAESFALFVQWVLRLGIESVEGIPWNTDTIRVMERACSCVRLECLDALPEALQDAAFTQILSLSELSEGEKVKLDFTSPLHEGLSLSVTA